MGDFNRTAENHHLKDFPDFNDLKIWQKRPTTTDLFLTNRKGSFTKSSTNETAMSDYRKPKFVYYRCFKSFNKELSKKNISKNLKNIDNSFEVYCDTFTNSLHCYAPSKKKKNRFNHNKFMTNYLWKNYLWKLWSDPVCAVSILKIAHTRTGQSIKTT